MRGLKNIFVVLFLLIAQVGFAQCDAKDYYAFYYTPNYTEDVEQWERVKLSFVNGGTTSVWELDVEYGEQGFVPGIGEGAVSTVQFDGLNSKQDILIHSGIVHGKIYDLYVCGELIGVFQDAHPLIELDFDLAIRKNRLYFVPFRSQSEDLQIYPDFTPNYIRISALLAAETTGVMNAQFLTNSSAFTHELVMFHEQIEMDIQMNIKPGQDHGYVSIMPIYRTESDPWVLLHSQYRLFQYTDSEIGVWNMENWTCQILENSSLGGWFDLRFVDNSVFGSTDTSSYLNKISISAKGNRKETCSGVWTNVYGQMVNKEGIYSDTISDLMGEDSLIYTTLKFHPPLFIDKITNTHFRATGSWDSYQWYNCNNDLLVGSGKDFYPEDSGDYYVVVTDDNCTEVSACIFIDKTIGVSELINGEISFFPNPAKEYLYISLEETPSSAVIVRDFAGRKLYEKFNEGNSLVALNVSGYPRGVYFLELHTENGNVLSTKVIIE